MTILPLFRSEMTFGKSLLTLEEPGKAKPGTPISIFDLAKEGGLKKVVLVDSRIDSYIAAYKTATKLDLDLCYGIQFVVCADMNDKSLDSRRTESKVIVFAKDYAGYQDLTRIYSRAWGDQGHVIMKLGQSMVLEYGRADWALLKSFWTERLMLGLPFFGSFIAKNTLTFNQITPDLSFYPKPWVMKEIQSNLPFAPLIDSAIKRFVGEESNPRGIVIPSKTICYRGPKDMKAYLTMRADSVGGTFFEPKTNHLASDRFSWESYLSLVNPTSAATS